jgi:hypothetical protein
MFGFCTVKADEPALKAALKVAYHRELLYYRNEQIGAQRLLKKHNGVTSYFYLSITPVMERCLC